MRTEGWRSSRTPSTLDLADAIYDDLLRLEHDLGIVPADNLFEGRRTTRIYNLLVHGPLYERIPVHPNVLPIVEQVLDPGLLISSLSSIAIGSDEQAQPIHSDDQLIPLPKPHPPLICNTMWAITDFTEENGATRLCPGTHRGRSLPRPRSSTTTRSRPRCPRVASSSGSGACGTEAERTRPHERRVGIAMNYCAGYVRQQENQQLGIPLETVRRFPRRLQELCGYSIYNGLIGHIDKQHPGKLLLGTDEDSSLVWDYAKASET